MSLFIILLRHNCHLLNNNGFELLCNVCYWKFLLIAFVVSLHHQALISCGAKCYFLKLGYHLFLVVFLEKIENHEFSGFFSHSWSLKCRTFFRMAQKYSQFLQGKTVTVLLEQLKRSTFSLMSTRKSTHTKA